MTGILDYLKNAGETVLDYATPDAIFGNVGKVGHRRNMLLALQPDNSYTDAVTGDYVPPSQVVQPVQSEQPSDTGQKIKNGFGILDRVLGGQTITDAINGQKQVQAQRAMTQQAQAQMAQKRSMLDALHDSGQINDVAYYQAINDPESFGKMTVNQYEPKVVSPSGSVYANGQFTQAAAAPEKQQQPNVIKGDDGLYLYDPETQSLKKLTGWQQFAPRAAKSSSSKGSSDAPPSGFVLD